MKYKLDGQRAVPVFAHLEIQVDSSYVQVRFQQAFGPVLALMAWRHRGCRSCQEYPKLQIRRGRTTFEHPMVDKK